jgi:hypothetical protein
MTEPSFERRRRCVLTLAVAAAAASLGPAVAVAADATLARAMTIAHPVTITARPANNGGTATLAVGDRLEIVFDGNYVADPWVYRTKPNTRVLMLVSDHTAPVPATSPNQIVVPMEPRTITYRATARGTTRLTMILTGTLSNVPTPPPELSIAIHVVSSLSPGRATVTGDPAGVP